jgi:hypothetical protein
LSLETNKAKQISFTNLDKPANRDGVWGLGFIYIELGYKDISWTYSAQ